MRDIERRLARLEARPVVTPASIDKAAAFDWDGYAAVFAEETAHYTDEDWQRYNAQMGEILDGLGISA